MFKVERSLLVRYGLAILAVLLAFLFTTLLWPVLAPLPFPLFFIAVMITAFYGGFAPAFLAALLSTFVGDYFFIKPYYSFPTAPGAILRLAVFILAATFISWLTTARRRTEEAEKKQRLFLEAALSSIGDAVIATDTERRVTFLNPVAESLTGWSLKEAVGRPLEEVFNIIHEYTRQPVENPVTRVLREGTVSGLANHTLLIKRDGQEIPIDDSGAPIKDVDNTIHGVILVFRDITERRQAERANLRLAAIVESSDDAIIGKTLEGIITSWNKGAERIFGYTAQEVIGRPIFILAPPSRASEMPQILEKIRQGQRVDHYETVRRRKDGKEIDISLTVSPIQDATGRIIGASKIARDITERKRAQKALEEAHKKITNILESITDAFYALDPQWRYIYVNEKAVQYARKSKEALLGKNIWEVFPDFVGGTVYNEFHRAVREQAPVHFEIFYPPFNQWFEYHAYPSQEGLSVYVGDITERKRAEEELEKQREWFEVTLSSIGDAVIATDTQGGVTFMNAVAEALTGWSEELAKGRDVTEVFQIINQETRQPVESPVAKVIRQGVTVGLANHTLLIAKDGKERPIDDSGAPIQDTKGNLIGVVLVFRDITERQEAEKALREKEERFRVMADSAPVMIWVSGTDKLCDYFNKPWLEFTGRTLEQELGDGWAEGIHPEDSEGCLHAYITAFDAREPFTREYRLRRYDGEYRWVLNSGVPRFAPGGEFAGYIGSCIDITERKQAEEALRESEERYRRILETAGEGIWILDAEDRVVFCNNQMAEMMGYTVDEIVGKSVFKFMDEEGQTIAAPRMTRCRQGIRERYDNKFRRRDGTELWAIVSAAPIMDKEGRYAGVLGMHIDITDRKQAEKAEHFLAEASKVLASSLDYETTLVSVARLAVSGLADWCVIDIVHEAGAIHREVTAHRDLAREGLTHELKRYPPVLDSEDLVAKVLRSGEPEIYSEVSPTLLEAVARDAEHLRIIQALDPRSLMVVPLIAHNRTLGAITLVAAETGRRYSTSDLNLASDLAGRAALALNSARLHREIQEASLRKDEFLAMLAHELRNPLAPISNSLKLIQLRGTNDVNLRHSIDIIDRQVRHMTRLVNDLLEVSRITRGKVTLQKVLLELQPIVTQVVETSRPFIEARRHELSVSLPKEPIQLVADPVRIEQIIVNLLNNAAKYTEPGGHIWLSCAQEGGEVVLRVKDTGIGIPPEMLGRIFDLFTQVDQSLARSQGGLGIGLTLVRSLVEMHDGSVSAYSAGPGQGSEFVVRLPTFPRTLPTEANEINITEQSTTRRRLRILVVDDNVDAATTLGELLELLGHEVRVVYDGQAAIELAPAYRPDVVLLDIGLPGMNGFVVARRLREESHLSQAVIVALTGYGQEEDRPQFQEAGFDYHFTKPITLMALKQVLDAKMKE